MNRREPLIAAGISLLVALLVVIGLLLPKASAVHKAQGDLTAAQAREQSLRTQLARLKADAQRVKKLRHQLNQLQTKIPPTADLSSLIRLLQGAANAAAVDFLSVSPGNPAPPASATTGGAPGVSVIPVSITVTGSYFSVEEFLFRLESLPRAVKVGQITVSLGPNGFPQLQLLMTGQVFTTDVSAGPGSVPGPTTTLPAPEVSPAPSPSPTTGG